MTYAERVYRWEWTVEASPHELWPLLADTDHFNRDTGLPPVADAAEPANGRRVLGFRRFGVRFEWEEEPFEWVRPHAFGVVRRYRKGPFARLRVLCRLDPLLGGGTRVVYESRVTPKSLLGLATLPIGMRVVTQRQFGAVIRRYGRRAARGATAADTALDLKIDEGVHARAARAAAGFPAGEVDGALVKRLLEVVAGAGDASVARIRPYELADRWGVERREVLGLCLRAVRAGLLDLRWVVLCPLCRGAKASDAMLSEVEGRVHCESCNIDLAVDLDRSVEVVFRPNPAVREVDDQAFCIGGPQVTPHIVVQQLLPTGEARVVTPILEHGQHRLRILGEPGGLLLEAGAGGADAATFSALEMASLGAVPTLALESRITFENDAPAERLFVLERLGGNDQAARVVDVLGLQVFRDLFASQVLKYGQQFSAGTLTVLFTDLRDSTRMYREAGDAPAFGRVLGHFRVLRQEVVAEGGVVVKTIGDAVMATFREPAAAIRAVLACQARLASPAEGEPRLFLKAGIHAGTCIAVTLNERLDYFGTAVNLAARLERFAGGEDVVVSDAVRQDPGVAALLDEPAGGLKYESFEAEVKGLEGERFVLWRIRRA